MSSIKVKNCEGFGRIPQIIHEGVTDVLAHPLSKLFEKIYTQIFFKTMAQSNNHSSTQKGPKNKIENYWPIASSCSTSKNFERLILKRCDRLTFLAMQTILESSNMALKNVKAHLPQPFNCIALQLQSCSTLLMKISILRQKDWISISF